MSTLLVPPTLPEVPKRSEFYDRQDRQSYLELRAQVAIAFNEEVDTYVERLCGLLSGSLAAPPPNVFEHLRRDATEISERAINSARAPLEPRLEQFLPKPLGFIAGLWAPAKRQHEEKVEAAKRAHSEAIFHFAQNRLAFEAKRRTLDDEREARLKAVVDFQRRVVLDEADAVAEYVRLGLSHLHETPRMRVAYDKSSKLIILELDAPTLAQVIPAFRLRFVKTNDELRQILIPDRERKALYAKLLASICLRQVHWLFSLKGVAVYEVIALNLYVDTVDPTTGRDIRPCLISLRVDYTQFDALDLSRVEPIACLKQMRAAVSASPADLLAVRPILEFNMIDPRFIDGRDVLSKMDHRPNLMELNPSDFEALITNLFSKMGLETRLTQASRDGGVDCVAYDQRPVLGGKVVIQAKRYKNTVGVSAVRDLFGTVHNEGASKGILVTTSGYGRSAYDFANGKPLELLTGENLLYLLEEHAGISARIEVPEDWIEPPP